MRCERLQANVLWKLRSLQFSNQSADGEHYAAKPGDNSRLMQAPFENLAMWRILCLLTPQGRELETAARGLLAPHQLARYAGPRQVEQVRSSSGVPNGLASSALSFIRRRPRETASIWLLRRAESRSPCEASRLARVLCRLPYPASMQTTCSVSCARRRRPWLALGSTQAAGAQSFALAVDGVSFGYAHIYVIF